MGIWNRTEEPWKGLEHVYTPMTRIGVWRYRWRPSAQRFIITKLRWGYKRTKAKYGRTCGCIRRWSIGAMPIYYTVRGFSVLGRNFGYQGPRTFVRSRSEPHQTSLCCCVIVYFLAFKSRPETIHCWCRFTVTPQSLLPFSFPTTQLSFSQTIRSRCRPIAATLLLLKPHRVLTRRQPRQ